MKRPVLLVLSVIYLICLLSSSYLKAQIDLENGLVAYYTFEGQYFDLLHFTTGIYFLTMQPTQGSFTKKILIEN